MKKDTFDLRNYLVENKMTMNSRTTKKPLGQVVLNEKVLGPVEESSSEGDLKTWDGHIKTSSDSVENLRSRLGSKYAVIPVSDRDRETYDFEDSDVSVVIPLSDEIFTLAGDTDYYITDFEGYKKGLEGCSDFTEFFEEFDPLKYGVDGFDNAPEGWEEKVETAFEGNLDEAGYTDFDDEEDNYEKDLDFSAGDSLVGKIGGSNKRAKKAAEKEMGSFDEPEQDDKETSFEDPEDLEGDGTEDAGQSFNIKYDPETVDMYMDDEELQEFLQGFRRPQVAAKVLQRAINQAQDEIDNSPGVSKLYLYLKNGFYHTDTFAKPGATIIGTFISKEKAARKKRF